MALSVPTPERLRNTRKLAVTNIDRAREATARPLIAISFEHARQFVEHQQDGESAVILRAANHDKRGVSELVASCRRVVENRPVTAGVC
jgi:hypothetical protein